MKYINKIESSPGLQFLILLLLGVLFFYPALGSGVFFIDDNGFLFESPALINSTSPLIFWDSSTANARSWPLSYTVFWVLYNTVGTKFWVYKAINLLVHVFNSFLVFNVFKEVFSKKSLVLASFLFLIHPIQVETVSWIFQLNTLMATTFFLLSLKYFLKFLENKNIYLYIGVLYLFIFSLLSKALAVFLPFVFLFHSLKNYGRKNLFAYAITIPFFLFSAYFGYESLTAIEGLNLDQRLSTEINQEIIADIAPKVNKAENIVKVVEVEKSDAVVKVAEVEKPYFDFNLEPYLKKLKISYASLSHYTFHFFFPMDLSVVYPDLTQVSLKNILIWLIGLAIPLLILIKLRDKCEFYYYMFFILLIFPVLGFFFVPFMNFSQVTDHWAYPALIPLSLLLVSLINRMNFKQKNYLFYILFFFWAFQTFSYVRVFNDKYQILETAIVNKPDDYRFRMELAMTYFKEEKFQESKQVIDEALKNPALENNFILLSQGGFLDRKLGDNKALTDKIYRIAQIYLKAARPKEAKMMLEQLIEVQADPLLIKDLRSKINNR
jgi:hypothetical protein